MLDERGLEGVEMLRIGREILHGPDPRPVRLDGEQRARLHGAPVEVDGAGAALRGVAADLRARQVEVVADDVDEQPPRLDVELDRAAIDGEPDRDLVQAGTPTAATSSSALPMPSTIRSIWSSVITNGGEMWIA